MSDKYVPYRPTQNMITAALVLQPELNRQDIINMYQAMLDVCQDHDPYNFSMEKSTEKMLRYIVQYTKDHNIPPSYDEIADHMRSTKSNIAQRLARMKRDKIVTYKKNHPRTLRVLVKVEFDPIN